MGRGVAFIGLLASVMIVGVLARKRMETVPSIVNKVLPTEAGDQAPKTLQEVPGHVKKVLNRTIQNRSQNISHQSGEE